MHQLNPVSARNYSGPLTAAAVAHADDERHVESTLSNLEAQVLQLRVEGRGQTEIAKHLQRHAKAVDNARQRVRRKVEDHLEAWEPEAAG